MPADPGAGLSPSQQLPTTPDAIGHVAPDFASRKIFNALVVRPAFRISLRLGMIDDLCPQPSNTDPGRRTRLQLLGYYYNNLNAPAAEITESFNAVWNWFTSELGKSEADLDSELITSIVENGELPAPGSFAKIWFPGGFCYSRAEFSEALGGPVATPPTRHVRFRREQAMWDANPVLGAIPLIALVEKMGSDGNWAPAKNVAVYLQLLPPDDLPATHKPPDARASTTFSPAPGNPGPKGYVGDHIADSTGDGSTAPADPADDPQADNAHEKVGGKRGPKAAGSTLELTMSGGGTRPGYYTAHPGRAIDGRPPFFNAPEDAPADGDKHRHAVRAATNENGEAGFVFTPSRTAGDRYKLRAYIGPPSLPSDGSDEQSVRVDTGTFVIWRRIRVAKYLVWNYPPGFVQPPMPSGSSSGWTQQEQMNLRIRRMGRIDLTTVQDEYRKAWIDMELESTAARHVITSAEWTSARNHAIANWAAINGNDPSGTTNLQHLFPTSNTTPHLVSIRDRDSYNVGRNNGVPAPSAFPAFPNNNAYWTAMRSRISEFKDGFMHFWTRGALPFVIVQSPFGDSLTFSGNVPGAVSNSFLTTSGVATPWRGCYLWWGEDFYPLFSYTGPAHPQQIDYNTVHESGHCHFLAHHWTSSGPPLAGGLPADHDQKDFCVMGYLSVPGDLCGRCHFKLRGWDVAAIPANP